MVPEQLRHQDLFGGLLLLEAAEIRCQIFDVSVRQAHGKHLHQVIAAGTVPVGLRG